MRGAGLLERATAGRRRKPACVASPRRAGAVALSGIALGVALLRRRR